jgi:hypothetical protein
MVNMADDITLRTIVEHIQGLRDSLEGRMDRLEGRIGKLESRVDIMDLRLSSQIDALDRRLDTIKIAIVEQRHEPRIRALEQVCLPPLPAR